LETSAASAAHEASEEEDSGRKEISEEGDLDFGAGERSLETNRAECIVNDVAVFSPRICGESTGSAGDAILTASVASWVDEDACVSWADTLEAVS